MKDILNRLTQANFYLYELSFFILGWITNEYLPEYRTIGWGGCHNISPINIFDPQKVGNTKT